MEPRKTPPSASAAEREPSVALSRSGIFGKRERDIYSVIEFNGEVSAAEIGKRLKLPASTVAYTLRRLQEHTLIRPKYFINSFQLGLLDVGFFFSLAEQSAKHRQSLIARFRDHPSVAYFGSVLGDYQYVAVFLCEDLVHFSRMLAELTGSCENFVTDKRVVPRLGVHRFTRKYLNPKLASDRVLTLRADGAPVKLDETDERIVLALGNRPYDSLREVARHLGLPLATVDRRVKKLRENGVADGVFYDLDIAALGIQSFRVLVNVQGLSSCFSEKIFNVCAKHPLVTYLVESLGTWDFEIGIETPDARLVSSVIEELHAQTGGHIGGTQVLMELEDFMCRYYPGKLGGGAPRV